MMQVECLCQGASGMSVMILIDCLCLMLVECACYDAGRMPMS